MNDRALTISFTWYSDQEEVSLDPYISIEERENIRQMIKNTLTPILQNLSEKYIEQVGFINGSIVFTERTDP